MSKNLDSIQTIDRIVLKVAISSFFAFPIIAIFIWASPHNWTAWVQAVGSIEAIVASPMIAISMHQRSVKTELARRAYDHARVFANLRSLIQQTHHHLKYICDNSAGGLEKKESAARQPSPGSSAKSWMSYGFKAADIRRSLSLFEKSLRQLSMFSVAEVGDAVVVSKISSFISNCEVFIEEVSASWDESGVRGDSALSDNEEISSDPIMYPPGTPNLSPSQKRIGISQFIARGYFVFYFSNDLPPQIIELYEELMAALDTNRMEKASPY